MNYASTLGRCSRNIGSVVFRQQDEVSLANTIGSGANADPLRTCWSNRQQHSGGYGRMIAQAMRLQVAGQGSKL